MNKAKRIFSIVVTLSILITSCISFQSSIYAASLQSQQSTLESRLNQLKKDQEAISKSLAEAKAKTNEQVRVVELLYDEINSYQSELNTMTELIQEYRTVAQEKQRQIEDLNARMENNFELFKKRLVFAQESGDMSLIDFILGSSDLTDILSRSEQINDMLEYDRKLIQSLVDDRQEVETAKAEVETSLKKCEEKQAEYETLLAQVNEKVEEANKYLEELKEDQAAQQAKLNAINNSKKQTEKELDDVIKRIAEEANRGSVEPIPFEGTWIWPLPKSHVGYITQHFGSGHTGLDIGVGGYSYDGKVPALAVAAGTVVRTGNYWDWGNLVVVDHGSGYLTYYAHLNKILVSNGQKVSQGQQVGMIGNTGASQGVHLHLCFYAPVKNASGKVESIRVNPLQFISYPG